MLNILNFNTDSCQIIGKDQIDSEAVVMASIISFLNKFGDKNFPARFYREDSTFMKFENMLRKHSENEKGFSHNNVFVRKKGMSIEIIWM